MGTIRVKIEEKRKNKLFFIISCFIIVGFGFYLSQILNQINKNQQANSQILQQWSLTIDK